MLHSFQSSAAVSMSFGMPDKPYSYTVADNMVAKCRLQYSGLVSGMWALLMIEEEEGSMNIYLNV